MSTKAQKHKSTKNESDPRTIRPINLILFFTLAFFITNSFIALFLPQAASALTKPTLVSPANNAQITTTSCTFTWTHPYNDKYELKIKTSGGTLKYASGKISSKSITVNLAGIPLTVGSTYKWYVVVYANGQDISSADRYFTYNPVTTGNVSGKLHIGSASGAALSGASVTCGGKSTTTASNGSYTISGAAQGSQTLSFSKTGYESYSRRITITVGKTFNAGDNFLLANVTDDHGNNCSNATSMSVNTSKAGKIEKAGDYDYFKVQVTSAGNIRIYTTGSTDTKGELKNSACTTTLSNDDGYDGRNFLISSSVTKGTYYVVVRHYSSTGTGAYTLNIQFTGFTAGWSNVTGFRHAETVKQKAIVAAALNGGKRNSPQSITGSPWWTDTYNYDGDRMRKAIKAVYDYWVRKGKPSLPLSSIPSDVQTTMRASLNTYAFSNQTTFIEQIRTVFNGSVPTTDDQTLAYLRIRAQCKEFADRTVKAGNGTTHTYGIALAVQNANIRPGMYAFARGDGHAAIVVSVKWNASGEATNLRLAESNWGTGWSNPAGQVPWLRTVDTTRERPLSEFYVVSTE